MTRSEFEQLDKEAIAIKSNIDTLKNEMNLKIQAILDSYQPFLSELKSKHDALVYRLGTEEVI